MQSNPSNLFQHLYTFASCHSYWSLVPQHYQLQQQVEPCWEVLLACSSVTFICLLLWCTLTEAAIAVLQIAATSSV
jgi:hypothetical protein